MLIFSYPIPYKDTAKVPVGSSVLRLNTLNPRFNPWEVRGTALSFYIDVFPLGFRFTSLNISLTVTTNAVVASIKVSFATGQFSLGHNTRRSKMFITTSGLWIADELTLSTLAQATFGSDEDYALVCYFLIEGLVSTAGRGFCCRNEIMIQFKKAIKKIILFKAWKGIVNITSLKFAINVSTPEKCVHARNNATELLAFWLSSRYN